MTRIFVAGSSGQVALSLKEAAEQKRISCLTAGRPSFDLLAPTGMQKAIEAFSPTVIVNAAAYTAVDAAENDEATATAINAEGAAALAAIAHKLNTPFLHISTDYVFDGTKEGAYSETDKVSPAGAYGRSKLAGEIAVMKANPSSLIFRTAWVYSPFGKNFLKTMLTLAAKMDKLGVVGDQFGNPTYAPDIADALLSVITKLEEGNELSKFAGIYNLAGRDDTSWHGFASAIFEAGHELGHPVPVTNSITTEQYPTPAKRPANSRLDCNKIQQTFSIEMPSWQESTTKCVKRLFAEDLLG